MFATVFSAAVKGGVKLKGTYKFAIVTLIVFGLCFTIFTWGSSTVVPSAGVVKIIRYGFPMAWLQTTTGTPPPPPTQYDVLWLELIVDVVFVLILSLAISFIIMKGLSYDRQATS